MKSFSPLRRSLAALALLFGTLTAPAALAQEFQETQDWAATGGYLVLGGLNGFDLFPSDIRAMIDGSTLGFQIRGGYRFLPFLAAEVEGDFLSGWPVNVTVAGGGVIPLEADGGNVTGNLKAYLPLGRLQPYALVGIGGMWLNLDTAFVTGTACTPSYWGWWCTGTTSRLASGGGFVAKFGGGTDIMLTETFGLTIDAVYVLPTGELSNFDYVSLNWGAVFKF